MEINRNQWFMAGLLMLFLGLQFHGIDSFVLTPELTKFLADGTGHPIASADHAIGAVVNAQVVPPQTVTPPEWLSWALLSLGAVLVLQSLSMKKPD